MTATQFVFDTSDGLLMTKTWAHWMSGTTYPKLGPKWKLIEADDGTRRDKPIGDSIETLPTANKWHPDNVSPITDQSWAVMESKDSDTVGTAHFQIFLQVSVSGGDYVWDQYMFPYQDWTVDATPNPAPSDATPTRPAREITQADIDFLGPLFHLISVADETSVVIVAFSETTTVDKELEISYAGEATLLPTRGSSFTVTRPFIQTITPMTHVDLNPVNGNFGYYTESGQKVLKGAMGYDRPVGGPDHQPVAQKPSTRGGAYQAFNISVGFFDEGSDAFGMFGYLRNLCTLNGQIGAWGYLFGREYIYFSLDPSLRNSWGLIWDGATDIMGGGD